MACGKARVCQVLRTYLPGMYELIRTYVGENYLPRPRRLEVWLLVQRAACAGIVCVCVANFYSVRCSKGSWLIHLASRRPGLKHNFNPQTPICCHSCCHRNCPNAPTHYDRTTNQNGTYIAGLYKNTRIYTVPGSYEYGIRQSVTSQIPKAELRCCCYQYEYY